MYWEGVRQVELNKARILSWTFRAIMKEYKLIQSLLDTAQSQFSALQVALANGVTTGSSTFLERTHSEQLQNSLINDNYLFPCILFFFPVIRAMYPSVFAALNHSEY